MELVGLGSLYLSLKLEKVLLLSIALMEAAPKPAFAARYSEQQDINV
jgi:hypothetical protein